MTKNKKSDYEKEKELLDTIADAKKKLAKLLDKQKLEIGSLAHKHGLHQFGIKKLDSAFSKVAKELIAEH